MSDLRTRKTLLNGSDTARDAIELYLKGREVFSAMQEEDTMYESPVTILYERVAKAANERLEDHIMKEIHSVGVVVDKDELIRAMNYDRGQYHKGYTDGYIAGCAENQNKSRWIPVTERLPESGTHVLLCCEMRPNGKRYVCDGYYAKAKTHPSYGFPDECAVEYDEEDDEYYLLEGWYEVIKNWEDYNSVVVGDFVTHWMPLPEPPKGEQHDA